VLYLDSSAILKLIVHEPESAGLFAFLAREDERASSALATVEVARALRRMEAGHQTRERAGEVLDRLSLIRLDDVILEEASALEPASVRSLDAIHIASALALGDELSAVVTYDRRMAEGAALCGLRTVAPTRSGERG